MIKIKEIVSINSLLLKKYSKILRAGWLEDDKRYLPDWDIFGRLGNGMVVKKSRKIDPDITIKNVVGELEMKKRPIFSKPANDKRKINDIIKFIANAGYDKNVSVKKLFNLGKAIFMIPMLKGVYKKESKVWREEKGFSRPTIFTGQTVNAIKADLKNANLKVGKYGK